MDYQIGLGRPIVGQERSFHIVIGNKVHGRYIAKSPLAAAKKAFSKLSHGKQTYKAKFSIVESTQGRPKKQFHYVGHKMHIPPKQVVRGGKVVVYKSKIIVKKA
jgi:hypothetical protein